MITYSKGLHILVELATEQTKALSDYSHVKEILDHLILKHHLTIVGQVFHNFEGGGFTGVYCLTESHISIHTWPEFNRITYDVFLSNFRNNNENIVRDIHQNLVDFFAPFEITKNELFR